MIRTFDFSINLKQAILWQYEEASSLIALVQNKQNFVDENHTQFWNDWYNDVLVVDTCNFFGASVWAIILDVPLLINAPFITEGGVGFGFGEFRQNFEYSNFQPIGQGAQLLTLQQRRISLKMRYQRLTTGASIPEINKILFDAFGAGVYARKTANMAIEYVFPFIIPSWIIYIFSSLDVFPTPATVSATLVEEP